MAPAAKGYVRLVAHVPADIHRAIRLEAVTRGITIGDLLVEALEQRVVVTTHQPCDHHRKDPAK